MNCVEIQEQMVEFLLDELDQTERANVERHLAGGCIECNLQLTTFRDSIDLYWQSVPNERISDDLQHAILARAIDSTPEVDSARFASRNLDNIPSKASIVSNLTLQSLVAFAAGILFTIAIQSIGPDSAEQPTTVAQRVPTDNEVSLASPQIPSTLEMIGKQQETTHLVSMRKRSNSSELRGYVLWDSLAREIHLYCFGLKQPQLGSQYSLWLIGPSVEFRAAERLDIDAEGNCKTIVHWPEGEFRFARVTIEPSSSMNSRPSDNVELTTNALPVFPR